MSTFRVSLLAVTLGVACGGNEQAAPPPSTSTSTASERSPEEPALAEAEQRAPTEAAPDPCAGRVETLEARIQAIANEHSACRNDSECVAAAVVADCYYACGVAIHPSGAPAIDALTAEMTSRGCAEWEAAGCPPHRVRCERWHPGCIDGRCSTQGRAP